MQGRPSQLCEGYCPGHMSPCVRDTEKTKSVAPPQNKYRKLQKHYGLNTVQGRPPQVPPGGHCCADCLPPVHVGSPICKAPQIFAEWLHQTGQQPKQSPDHPNCRVETESPGHPTKWSAERVAEWLPPRVQIKLDLPSLRLRPTQGVGCLRPRAQQRGGCVRDPTRYA